MTKTAIALALAALTLIGAPLIGTRAARAADDYTINVIVPLTGGAAFVGGGQKDTLEALAAVINKDGGIQNHKLVFSYHDDQSSPQVAVQLKDYIANLTDFAGVDGIYDFKKFPQRGVGPQSSTVTTYDAQKKAWTWLSKPGGEPLSK